MKPSQQPISKSIGLYEAIAKELGVTLSRNFALVHAYIKMEKLSKN